MSARLFIDECFPGPVAVALEQAGYSCTYAWTVCLSAPDPDVARTARRLGLALLTEDRGFGRLFLGSVDPPPTVILAMGSGSSSREKADRLLAVLADAPEVLERGLTVVERDRVRRRDLPIRDYTRPIA